MSINFSEVSDNKIQGSSKSVSVNNEATES